MGRKPGQPLCGITVGADDLADDFHEPMRTLLAYWDERCEGRPALPRANLEPLDIPRLLKNVFLVDLVSRAPFDVTFRLLGTKVVDNEGEFTGKPLSELIARGPETESLWQHYERVMDGEVCLRLDSLAWQDREFVLYDVLLLPMMRRGESIDSALGMALYGEPIQGQS
jgi:hypothetical protein